LFPQTTIRSADPAGIATYQVSPETVKFRKDFSQKVSASLTVLVNCGGSAGFGTGSGSSPNAPTEVKPTKPSSADNSKSGQKSARS
jgi:hypothetical protein